MPKLQDKTEETIIAMGQAALDRWGRGAPSGFTKISADEVTYFDPATVRRLDGLDALRKFCAAIKGKKSIQRYDMIDPKVQIHADTAVLTFNLIDHIPTSGGSTRRECWSSTQVYSRMDGEWRLIHAHWSRPELRKDPYEKWQEPAKRFKIYVQMAIGVLIFYALGAKVVAYMLPSSIPPILSTIESTPALELVAIGLAFSAGVELAYMLFTPGPDEALEPLILGLASSTLLVVSKCAEFTWEVSLAVAVFSAAIAVLFWTRERFL